MIEKYFVVAHWGDKSYRDGGLALVRDSRDKPGVREILAIGVFSNRGWIIEDWPSSDYQYLRGGKQLELDDAIWDAVVRLREAQEGDSKGEEAEARAAFEDMIGTELQVQMSFAGVGG